MSNTTVEVDVREDIRNGREPFSKIMQAVAGLGPDQRMLLIAPFEPIPLVHLLKKQGFQHTTRTNEAGDWEVLFVRQDTKSQPTRTADHHAAKTTKRTTSVQPDVVEVDARGLEPPLPMVKILEALSTLAPGAELRGRTDRRPIHLYAQLEERGFCAQTEEQSDGSFLTHIRHR